MLRYWRRLGAVLKSLNTTRLALLVRHRRSLRRAPGILDAIFYRTGPERCVCGASDASPTGDTAAGVIQPAISQAIILEPEAKA